MLDIDSRQRLIYPLLGARFDLGWVRLSGVGLGNSLFVYCTALVIAKQTNATVVAPAWYSLKIGHKLRRERAKRRYVFAPPPEQLVGVRKFIALGLNFLKRRVKFAGPELLPPMDRRLTVLTRADFNFERLLGHREYIRDHLLALFDFPKERSLRWGAEHYVAVHVRLGDFAAVADNAVVSGRSNSRIPMSWYVAVVTEIRRRWPRAEIRLFSDGDESQLSELVALGGVMHVSQSDANDLIELSGASLLVGSNSTYSYWAAFLGDMPTVWLRTMQPRARMSSPSTPTTELDLTPDFTEFSRFAERIVL